MIEAIERKLERVEAEQPIDLDSIDLDLKNPELVRARLGDALLYAQGVEIDVIGEDFRALMPRSQDGYTDRFITVWAPQEQHHGLGIAKLLEVLELEPREASVKEVPKGYEMIGKLGEHSEIVHETFEHLFHVVGALHERITARAYKEIELILLELGEVSLVETLFKPIEAQEPVHLGYYRTVAQHQARSLSKWQRLLIRTYVEHTYMPVGAGPKGDKAGFGRTYLQLTDNSPHIEKFTGRVQELADDLLLPGRVANHDFVKRSVIRCIEQALAA